MTSSVDVNGDKAKSAKQYILLGGTLDSNKKLKSGLGITGDEAYSTKTPGGTDHRLGIRPMPGITSIDVKSKSAYGSLREITINFQCWDIHQLEELELLYMRPGYTVLIEWGWLPYIDNKDKYQPNFTDFYDILNKGITERSKIFKELYEKTTKTHNGNYDAMFGYIKNYQWSAREDGGYDCQTTVISTGEIIESLKINYLKSNLSDYKLYDTGSIGNGLLNDLFTKQGNNPSTKFTDHYEKNILAGTWAELAYKLKDPNAAISPTSSIHYATIQMPGLVNNGDSTSMIDPGSKFQEYITLESVFNILNKYIIAKDSSGEPLITLSTKANTYSSDGSQLVCIAHPLQISTDPSVCVIKNPLWEDLLGSVVASVAPTKAAIQNTADSIAQELIDASEDDIGLFGGGYGGTNEKAFLTALKKINTAEIYSIVDKIFVDGTTYAGKSTGGSWTFSSGINGLITQEFIGGSSDGETVNNVKISTLSSPVAQVTYDTDIVNTWYLFQIQQHLISIGATVSVSLTGNSTTIELSDLLKKSKFPTPTSLEQIAEVVGNYNVGTTVFDKVYLPSSVSISFPNAANSVGTITISAEDAKAMITDINKACAMSYFKGDIYDEVGILGNIYVNLDFLYKLSTSGQIESQDSKEKNEINVYSYVKNIISGLNNTLGVAANLEIHVDPIDSIGRVIDVNYTEKDKANKKDLFELQVQNLKSVVRSYSLKSKIAPNQSALIAIGSQAKGGQLGMQNNTMIDFNKNLTDRIIAQKADNETANTQNTNQPIVANSLASIITLYALCHQDSKGGSAYADVVSKCKNALRDIISYFQALISSPGSNRNIIPIEFSFEMDGIGGLVIGHLFTLNSGILPKGYKGEKGIGSTLAQTITGISHKISNSDWTTTINALNIVLDKKTGSFKNVNIKEIIKAIIKLAIDRANAIQVITNPPPGTPPGGTPPGGIPPTGVAGNPTAMQLAGDTLYGAIGGEDRKCAIYTYSIAKNYVNAIKGGQIYASLTGGQGNAGDTSYRNNLVKLGYTMTSLGVLTKADLQKQISSISSIGTIINYRSTVVPDPSGGSTIKNCAQTNYVYCYGHTQIYTGGVLTKGGRYNGGSNGTKWASSWANNYNSAQVYYNKYSFVDAWEAYVFTL
jgi:hypothetical protein